ncbi:MAG: hypothetical protein ACLGHC_09295 [Alphaproteobacteria bacterium]
MTPSRLSNGLPIAAALVLALAPAPAFAGVNKAHATAGPTIVYLGVVPAAHAREYASERVGEMRMSGVSPRDVNTIHVVVALFDRGTGKRVTNAKVSARFVSERGRRWSVMLEPMTMNGALTYGGYFNLGGNNETSILIDVARPAGGKIQNSTARFEYSRD